MRISPLLRGDLSCQRGPARSVLCQRFREVRLKWRPAGVHGSAERKARAGDDGGALLLVARALETLDVCAKRTARDAVAIRASETS
jgi:hypothetical protein